MTELYFRAIDQARNPGDSKAAHDLLEEAAHRKWPDLPTPLPMQKDKNGKPFFQGFPGRYFNLSHSGAWVVCALSDHPVGVDLQAHRQVPVRVARHFTPGEQGWLETQPDAAFFDLWVKKEAYLKAVGTGLTRRLDSFSVLPIEENQVGEWTIRLVQPPEEGYSCALCEGKE